MNVIIEQQLFLGLEHISRTDVPLATRLTLAALDPAMVRLWPAMATSRDHPDALALVLQVHSDEDGWTNVRAFNANLLDMEPAMRAELVALLDTVPDDTEGPTL